MKYTYIVATAVAVASTAGAVLFFFKKGKKKEHKDMKNSEFPMDDEGRTYHLNTKKGEVANRIICVGDLGRARLFSTLLQKIYFCHPSHRGFITFTGLYNNTPVSIIGTGMGLPMTDFTIRENLPIIDGDVIMLRIGTCGTPQENIPVGSVVVNDSSILVSRNPDAFRKGSKEAPYRISEPVFSDKELITKLQEKIPKYFKGNVYVGRNLSADYFYASQGRKHPNFDDRNEDLIDEVKKKHDIVSIEMESFHMMDLAECSKDKKMRAASAAIVLAQRTTKEFLPVEKKHEVEIALGKAGLDAITSVELKNVMKGTKDDPCVWEKSSTCTIL